MRSEFVGPKGMKNFLNHGNSPVAGMGFVSLGRGRLPWSITRGKGHPMTTSEGHFAF